MNKHRGGILLVTLFFFAFTTIVMFAVMGLSIEEQRSTAMSANQTSVTYNLMSLADLAVDAAVYDLTTCSATVGITFVGDVVDSYDAGLQAMQAEIFPSNVYWIDDIGYLVAYEGLPTTMDTAVQEATENLALTITLDSTIQIQGSSTNVLEGEDGDYATLKPMTLTVTTAQGVTTVERTYEVSGIVAQFQHTGSGVYITIGDGGSTKLVAQTIT